MRMEKKHAGDYIVVTRLKRYLFEHGIKQTWVQERSGIGQSWLNRIINGKATPTVYDAIKIARSLGVRVEDIFSLEEESHGDI